MFKRTMKNRLTRAKVVLRTVYVPEPHILTQKDQDEVDKSISKMAQAAENLHTQLSIPISAVEKDIEKLMSILTIKLL